MLIVETKGFTPARIVRTSNLVYGEDFRVTERFSLDPAMMTLTRSYVATDPQYFLGEFTGKDILKLAEIPYQPYDCEDLTVY